MRVAAVVLAAGASRRLGRPKQRVVVAGETLLWRAVRTAHEGGLQPVLVVVREEEAGHVFPEEFQAISLPNSAADEGLAASIRTGVRTAETMPALAGLVLMTCDQVGVTAGHLRQLYEVKERLTGSGYAGKTAIPAYVPRAFWPGLLALRGDVGARDLLRGAHRVMDEQLSLDVDTEEDVQRMRSLFG